MKNKILTFAENDKRVRAVLLNGSRANPNVKPDKYQDYDIVYIVTDFNSFLEDRSWMNYFGDILLQQIPDEMEFGNTEREKAGFTFLTIFEDGNRIDLTLFPQEKFATHYIKDSLTIARLDKDNYFTDTEESSDKDYHIQQPTQKKFSEISNEFWWTITYVAKGLKRGEIIYAKDILETVVRPVFWRLIEWNIANDYAFNISIGKSGKFAKDFLSQELYEDILKTFTDADIDNNWKAIFLMADIFKTQQIEFANKQNFQLNSIEAENAINYIKKIKEE